MRLVAHARRLSAQAGICRQITVAVPGSRRATRANAHREVKDGATGQVGGHPQPAAMSFDDRTADRQPHPQTAGLRRVERVEEAFETFRVQSRSRILHHDQHAIRFGWSGGDEQLSRPFRDLAHCLDRVDDEIEDDWLQLYTISFDERQPLPECRLYRRAILRRLTTGELDHLADRRVHVYPLLPRRRFLDELADSADDVAGAMGVLDDTAERLPDLLQIRRSCP